MLMQLVQEKRSGFDALVRAGNQAEYLVAMILAPLLGFLAWKSRFPLTQAGFGLLAASLVMLAIATRLMQRMLPMQNDHSLRDHLEALIQSYDLRIRFLRNGKIWVTVPMCAGIAAVILGTPASSTSALAWIITIAILVAFSVAQWKSFGREKASIQKKREEAVGLLQQLPRG